jgi:hypothetical protein
MTDEIKTRPGSGFVEDTSPEAKGKITTGNSREADTSAPSRQTHKFLQYPDGGTMPIWYRHQNKNKEVVFRGHTNQEDEEIIVTLPNKSGTLAVYGEGGSIDMEDYAKKEYVDDVVDDAKNDLRGEFNQDQQRQDELIASLSGDSADLSADIDTIKAEQITQNQDIGGNTADIKTIKAEQVVQDGKILANENAIKVNKEAIADNKKAIQGNSASIEALNQDVIELEEEIEAIAPSFERGLWNADLDTTHPRPPTEGKIYFGDGLQKITNFANVKEIFIHNKDALPIPQNHTWNDVEVGQMIEFFDEKDSDFLLAKITEVQKQSDYAYIKVDVVKYEGEHDVNPLRMKIFTIADTEVNLEAFMPKSGGTFTGNVNTDRGSVIIKGSNQSTGTNFSITNGKDFKQLYINGYGNLVYDKSATPADQMGGKTVAVMNDVALHSLGSTQTINWTTPRSLGASQFATNTDSINAIRSVYLYKLPDNNNAMQLVKDYEPTPATEFVIYYPNTGETLMRTLVKNWRMSDKASGDMMFDTPDYPNFYKLSTYLNSGSSYRVMFTNLKKK